LAAARFDVCTIPLRRSTQWQLRDGALRHTTGRFFAVVGTRWTDDAGRVWRTPLIEQREVGTLGFLLRDRGSRREVLAHAKVEPGNVGGCQLGPSYQATASNAGRVHGGAPPAHGEHFEAPAGLLSDVRQSEQGTRFLGKLNRNLTVLAAGPARPGPLHRWIGVDDLLDALHCDHLVNTDARSVLVCGPWDRLVTRDPFTRRPGRLADAFATSYATIDPARVNAATGALARLRAAVAAPEVLDLREVPGWSVNPFGVSGPGTPFRVKQIAVTAHGREVDRWDQPIVDSRGQGRADLHCALDDGVLRFCFLPRAEPGLLYRAELGPTVAVEPGMAARAAVRLPNRARVLASVRQSDEGGRFFRDVSRYRLVELPAPDGPPDGQWLSLGEICTLLRREGVFTNEARSALSLVLAWL